LKAPLSFVLILK